MTVMNAQIGDLDQSSSNFQVGGDIQKPMIENFQDTASGTVDIDLDLNNIVLAPSLTVGDLASVSPKIGLFPPEVENPVVLDKANNLTEGGAQDEVLVSGVDFQKKPNLLDASKQQFMKIMNNEAKF